jgi:hypothetical protein
MRENASGGIWESGEVEMSDKHLDDRKLMIEPAGADAPLRAALRLGCLASVMLAVLTNLGLFALMVAGELPWLFWPYLAAPAGLWVILLGIPVFFKSHRGTMAILDALVMTAEAYLARAGYVVDLNKDGAIGHVKPEIRPPQVTEVRPILLNAPGARVMPLDVGPGEPIEEEIPERKIWHCPGNVKVDQETLENFVDGIFERGLSRGRWVGPDLERETYDGMVALLENARLVEGRKPGHSGKLTVRRASQARAVLGLPRAG